MVAQDCDQNGGGIQRRRRVRVGMASFASQRPIARISASGSAKLWLLTCDRRHPHAISAEYARVPQPRERQAPITQLATKRRDPRRDRRQPGGETGQKWCDVSVTLGRAVCTHRMRLDGSHWRLGNGGCRQRMYDAGYRSRRTRKRRSTCISTGPCGRSAALSAGRHAGALPPFHFRSGGCQVQAGLLFSGVATPCFQEKAATVHGWTRGPGCPCRGSAVPSNATDRMIKLLEPPHAFVLLCKLTSAV